MLYIRITVPNPNLFEKFPLPPRKYSLLYGAIVACAIISCSKISPEVAPDPQVATPSTAYLVTEPAARQVAENIARSAEVYAQYRHNVTTGDTQRVFRGKQAILRFTAVPATDGKPAFYACDYQNGGFALVAADRHMRPILAFSEHGSFRYNVVSTANRGAAAAAPAPAMPDGLLTWVETTAAATVALRQYPDAKNTVPGASEAWQSLESLVCPISGDPDIDFACENQPAVITTQRGPLLTTAWGQGAPYNANCPVVSGVRSPTGCVATAMAQIMRYWQRPTSYSWAAMPDGPLNQFSGSFPALAQVMSDVGQRISTDYQPQGSGASSYRICPAFKNDFGYSSADYRAYPNASNGTNATTLLLPNCSYIDIMSNFNQGQPVIFGGYVQQGSFLGVKWPDGTGHAWVSDGYIQTAYVFTGITFLQFHMNWGWNQQSNGWYQFNNWQVNTGNGTTTNYRYCQDAVINIRP